MEAMLPASHDCFFNQRKHTPLIQFRGFTSQDWNNLSLYEFQWKISIELIRWKKSGVYQLRLVVYPIIYLRRFYASHVVQDFLPSMVDHEDFQKGAPTKNSARRKLDGGWTKLIWQIWLSNWIISPRIGV